MRRLAQALQLAQGAQAMHVVRLHPGGMPESERYTISELRVNRYLKKPDLDGVDARSVGYQPTVRRGVPYALVTSRVKRLSGDEACVIKVVADSVYAPYAGMTVFGSRRAQRYLMKHVPYYLGDADELEALFEGRTPEQFDAEATRIRNYEAALREGRVSAISDLVNDDAR